MKTELMFAIIKTILSQANVPLDKVYLAGGCLRNPRNPKDIDIFCDDYSTKMKVMDALAPFTVKGYFYSSNYALNAALKSFPDMPIQIITDVGPAEEIIKGFDFNVNQVYLYFKDDFNNDRLSSREIEITTFPKHPVNLMGRFLKFTKNEGFTFSKLTLERLFHKTLDAMEDDISYDFNDIFKDKNS